MMNVTSCFAGQQNRWIRVYEQKRSGPRILSGVEHAQPHSVRQLRRIVGNDCVMHRRCCHWFYNIQIELHSDSMKYIFFSIICLVLFSLVDKVSVEHPTDLYSML